MADVIFVDNSINVKAALNDAAIKWLYEAALLIESQTKDNTMADKSQLKNSWTHIVDELKQEAIVGSPLENAVWEEFGTGEYA
ncbi:MAG: hypothetical protein ACI4I9_05755, partial [Porcipelethomonas sp.]